MMGLDVGRDVERCDGVRRRDFLHTGSLVLPGVGLAPAAARRAVDTSKCERSCILLMLTGGPSQLDTWDMKPNAPVEIRGPYRPVKTNVPGVEISEIFPRMAQVADKFAIVRSMHHTGAAVHDAGYQMMQTGRLFQGGVEHPHLGCVLAKLQGGRGGAPPHVLLPGPMGNTGGNMPQGQSAGYLGKAYDPLVTGRAPAEAMTEKARAAFDLRPEPARVRDRYGRNRFGQSCLRARRMVEAGVRFVTVNMFATVFDEITWDIHGAAPFSPVSCYREHVGPMFDMAYSSLLEDLAQRGLLTSTMVVASGEFGRTPRVNPAGGRDHWAQCWSLLMAGGGVQGGQVVGSSDAMGAAPKDRPVTPAEVAATVYYGLGVDLRQELAGPGGRRIPVVDAGVQPIKELFV